MNALLKNEMVAAKIMGNRYYFCFRPHEKTNIIRIYRYTIIILCHWGMILGMLGKGMVIYMQNVNEVDLAVKPEELIARLRNGEEHLRDFMLEYYQKYILSLVSKMIGHPATSSDEYSVGLEAFNEAMDSFNPEEAASFLYFAKLVINRRVIDHIRKSKKYMAEYPFTYFEVQDREDYFESYTTNHESAFTERIEIQEELLLLKKNLELYGILFEEIAGCAPKHLDTKLLCLHIAKKLSTIPELGKKLEQERKLPIQELLQIFQVHRKTLENHRKYIIILYLVLNSNLEIIKSYGNFLMKGVNEL